MKRLPAAALAVSAALLAGIAAYEGFRAAPYVPVEGDVPTVGFGSTRYGDGAPVRLDDAPVTRARAAEMLAAHVAKDAAAFIEACPGCLYTLDEYDAYLDFAYQYGIGNWKKSSMLRLVRAGEYRAACEALLMWKYAAGRDCSVRSSGCYGVWTRQLERREKCLGERP